MEALGVITQIDHPTDWVSSINLCTKANSELCLCLDLHDLNRAICHDHHKMPTVEEITHKFTNLHYFTKLNTCHGYWSIVLDEESSLLTTFNSPFGRYHFLCLPFGLVCSQDIFQKKMDQFLEECPGCIGIADDITIHGCTETEHDICQQNLMKVAHKYGVVFNPEKTHVKASTVNFFGCLYDANGVHPDPEKVDAVHALPAPMNVTELQEFLGMVTYLSPFVHGLSTLTALWELLKKDADFTWNASYETTFEQVKEAVVSNTTLRYFDPSLPVTIQVNASQVGLGAALLQNNKLIAFASKALTDAECTYANIERQMLVVVFGAERFCTYIYGWSFTIKSDDKPLESISRKNLADMPAWLQCMMLCLQGYDLTICHHPGKEMVTPDTLSQFSPLARHQLSIGYCHPSCPHNANPQGSFPASLHQWSRNQSSHWSHHHWLAWGCQGSPSSPPSILATQRDPHHWGQSSPVGWSTHHSSCQKGESPASTASIPSRNNKVTVAHAWKFLLAWH